MNAFSNILKKNILDNLEVYNKENQIKKIIKKNDKQTFLKKIQLIELALHQKN